MLFSFSRKPIQMCKIIDGFPAGADILEKVFAAANLYYNYTGDQACNQIESDSDDSSSSLGLSGWGWQVLRATYVYER
jgi:lysosomal Pro-X carboxypeptidase